MLYRTGFFGLFFLILNSVGFNQNTDTLFIPVKDQKLFCILENPGNDMQATLAIIIGGSGPTDHNGNQPGMENNSLKMLSGHLVSHNISTLRFDKRGVGKSMTAGLDESNLRIAHYAEDVVALVHAMKKKGISEIYLIGHSEGALIGLIAAQELDISGYVSLCGAGQSADLLLKKQLKSKLSPEMFEAASHNLDSLKNGHPVKKFNPLLMSLFRPSVQPYLISWFAYDPADLIRKLDCQILIVQGGNDIQVDAAEAEILYDAASSGEYILLDNMNHVLKDVGGELGENINSYSNPDLPLNSVLIKALSEFMR